MQEYAQKPEKSSSDSNSRSSGQPPISEILQAYKNGTLQRLSVDEEKLFQAKTRDKSSERETLQQYLEYTHRDKSRYNSFIQGMFDTPQRKGVGNEEPLQGKFDSSSAASESTIQREVKPNNTGLPDNLKSGIENLSGYSLDDVKVHYNSDKPAQLSALAYAQGTDIHVAPGQERHLPHEAWHVVQQKQGRVQPTMQMQGVDVNDNSGLEKEADVIGSKAFVNAITLQRKGDYKSSGGTTQVVQCWWDWVPFVCSIPGMAAGLLDAILGSKNCISVARKSRYLIPEGSTVTLKSHTEGKVDSAKRVDGAEDELSGGTYTIEVSPEAKVKSTSNFTEENKSSKARRGVGSALSGLAGLASLAAPFGSFGSEYTADIFGKVFSVATGFGYSFANIPKVKGLCSIVKGLCSKKVSATNPQSEQ